MRAAPDPRMATTRAFEGASQNRHWWYNMSGGRKVLNPPRDPGTKGLHKSDARGTIKVEGRETPPAES